MLDHPGMKTAEVLEVPIEAAARDAELARKHIRLESIEALARERCQGEVDPVLRGQSLGHEVAPYNTVLTSTIAGDVVSPYTPVWRCRMQGLWLQAAGVLAILLAIAHSNIIELKVFAKARIEPQRMRNVLRMVSQASTVDWIGIGVLLIAAPAFGSQVPRQWVVAVAVVVYGYAAIGNAVVTRGRHPGSWLMGVAVARALMGL